MAENDGDPGVLLRDAEGTYYLIGQDVLDASRVTDAQLIADIEALGGDDVSGFAVDAFIWFEKAEGGGQSLPGGGFQGVRITPALGLRFS